MLAAWIKAARVHAGLTQEGLGDVVGVSKQNVNSWEKERHEPSFGQVVRIAQALSFPLPEVARMAGVQAGSSGAAADELSARSAALARLIDRIEPGLQVHVEALVHALQPAGESVSAVAASPSPVPTPAQPQVQRTRA